MNANLGQMSTASLQRKLRQVRTFQTYVAATQQERDGGALDACAILYALRSRGAIEVAA